eukprot:3504654-Alexandrium_andersonii.AAC.1
MLFAVDGSDMWACASCKAALRSAKRIVDRGASCVEEWRRRWLYCIASVVAQSMVQMQLPPIPHVAAQQLVAATSTVCAVRPQQGNECA